MSTCPVCGSAGAYVGFLDVECANPQCRWYQASGSTPAIMLSTTIPEWDAWLGKIKGVCGFGPGLTVLVWEDFPGRMDVTRRWAVHMGKTVLKSGKDLQYCFWLDAPNTQGGAGISQWERDKKMPIRIVSTTKEHLQSPHTFQPFIEELHYGETLILEVSKEQSGRLRCVCVFGGTIRLELLFDFIGRQP